VSALGIGKMAIKLEIGKRYVTRGGDITGPLSDGGGSPGSPYDFKDRNTNCSYIITGNYWDNGKSCPKDLIKEYIEEGAAVFKLEEGKQYITKDGKYYTEPFTPKNRSSGKIEAYYIATFSIVDNKKSSTWNYFPNGNWVGEPDSGYSLVAEYVPKSQITLPLKTGNKYVAKNGLVIEIAVVSAGIAEGSHNNEFVMYYFANTGLPNIENTDYMLVSDFVGKKYTTKKASPKEKKKPIKYDNLKFLEAWEFAKETKKRYRFKDGEWLVYPEVKITKEQFEKDEWELEK